MSTSFDVQDLADELAALAARPHLHKVVVVLPLAPGMRQVAWDFLAEGPPYDFAKAGIDRHEVFLTDDEAIFVFSTPQGPATLERSSSATRNGRCVALAVALLRPTEQTGARPSTRVSLSPGWSSFQQRFSRLWVS